MKVTFTGPKAGAPDHLLGEGAIHFEHEPLLVGIKLVGFTVWRGDRGLYVTSPSRAFGVGDERKYFDYVRSANDEHDDATVQRLKTWIIEEFTDWQAAQKAVAASTEAARVPDHAPAPAPRGGPRGRSRGHSRGDYRPGRGRE